MTLFLLLVGCGLGRGPTTRDAADRRGSVDTGVAADTADSGTDSGGDTPVDSVPSDTGTGDSADDSAVDTAVDTGGHSDACDPSPYLHLDTGLDTGAGPAVEVRTDAGVVDERYVEDTTDDCEVSTVSAGGDPLLECLGTTLDLATGYEVSERSPDWEFEWAGDLDDDGYDDVLLTGIFSDSRYSDDVHRFLIYGSADGVPEGVMLDPAEVADATIDSAEIRATSGYGDMDGDGHVDLVVASGALEEPGTDAGIIFGDGVRLTGTPTTLGVANYWSDTVDSTAVGWAGYQMTYYDNGNSSGYPRETFVIDLDSDGLSDLLVPSTDDYLLAAIRGEAGLVPGGAVVDAATWTVTQDERCWWDDEYGSEPVYYACWRSRSVPVGDLDGDGSATVAMMLGAVGVSRGSGVAEIGNRVALLSLPNFPDCTYDWEDLAAAVLSVGDGQDGVRSGYTTWQNLSTPIAVRDLNGDGSDDLVVVARTRGTYGHDNMAAWMLYGGERWLRFGGALESATDRIEFAMLDDAAQEWNWSPGAMQAADLNSDSLDDLLVGGTHPSDTISRDDAFYGRGHLDIVAGEVGGLRGVVRMEDVVSASLVTPPDSVVAYAGRGRGDLDGDGAEDALVTWTTRWWTTGFDGSRDEDYYLAAGAMISATDLDTVW